MESKADVLERCKDKILAYYENLNQNLGIAADAVSASIYSYNRSVYADKSIEGTVRNDMTSHYFEVAREVRAQLIKEHGDAYAKLEALRKYYCRDGLALVKQLFDSRPQWEKDAEEERELNDAYSVCYEWINSKESP